MADEQRPPGGRRALDTAAGFLVLVGRFIEWATRPLKRRWNSNDPLDAYSLVHMASAAGDTLVAIALADSVFFSLKPDEARIHVALYLGLTMAPLAVKTSRGVADWRRELCVGERRLPGCAVTTGLENLTMVGRLYGAKTTPHMFVINPEGKILYNGAIDSIRSADKSDIQKATNYVSAALDTAMAGKPVAVATSQPGQPRGREMARCTDPPRR